MSRPLRITYSGAVYHLTCRGNERQDIFRDDRDRMRFLELLSQSSEIYYVKVYAYVLMSNHFHLLVETPLGNLSEFMRRFNISYTGYFNKRHQRVGHLYQGRYKSILVEKDSYLLIVSRYIHLNPVRTAEMKDKKANEKSAYLKAYRWSSLPAYILKDSGDGIADYQAVLSLYCEDTDSARHRYWNEISYDVHQPYDLKSCTVGQSILGSESFIMQKRCELQETGKDRECPTLQKIKTYNVKEDILAAVREETGKTVKEITVERGDIRQVAMDLLYRRGGLKGREIGDLFGVDYSTVSIGRKRLLEKLKKDADLSQLMNRLELRLSKIKN